MMASPESHRRLAISYVLWLGGFFGFSGLHRIYNGKMVTGIIWFLTLGLFGVGQFIDVFLVPGMSEEHHLKRLKAKYGDDIYDLLNTPVVTRQVVQQPTREENMVKLLQAAQKHGGQLSVTRAVLETGLGFEEVEILLREMVKSGYVAVDNHPKTGVVIYHFDELTT
jgi:TM2 domain-containing membrane protein YozV